MTDLAPKNAGQGPARGYSWRAAWRGNHLATKHGAWSPRVVDPLATELVEMTLELLPYLSDQAYRPALWRWAQSEVRVQLLSEDVGLNGITDACGIERAAHKALLAWSKRAENSASKLGLDPSSRAKIERDLSSSVANRVTSLADAMKEGRRIREAAQAHITKEEGP